MLTIAVVLGRIAIGLLVVDGVVLDLRHGAGALDPVYFGRSDVAGQVRILTQALEGPAPLRDPDDVHGRTVDKIDPLPSRLGTDDLSEAGCGGRIERGGKRLGGRQLGDAG